MSVFRTATTPQQRIDPFKRVKYSLGLVLGVDEFEQEQGFFLERGRLENRSLHGYGTVYGLKVTPSADQITVAPGLAIDPLGREIRVGQAQCANLNEWLASAENRPDKVAPTTLDIYVLLAYRECETDKVPVPGAPCRSDDENLVPSRMTESFDLKFSLAPPNEREEDAVEAFGELLRRIEVTDDDSAGSISVDDVPALVNAISREGWHVRPGRDLPDISPIREVREIILPKEGRFRSPVADDTLRVRSNQIEAVLEAMFRVWVTEVRPRILQLQTGANATPADQSVLLAQLTVAVDRAWQATTVTVHEEERPVLLHTRLIQEYLLNREQSRDHDTLEGLGHDDHRQYLLVDPADRSLIADLNADGHKVKGLAKAEQAGDAVPFEQAVKEGDAAGGDVGGRFHGELRVQGLMGRPISEVKPPVEAHLIFNGKEWEPKLPPPSGVTDHALLQGLDKDDHKQYLLASGSRALGGNLDGNKKRIINLSQSVSDGDPIVRGEGATGDLGGKYPAPTVTQLQGNPVDPNKPAAAGLVLTWDGAKWTSKAFDLLTPVATQLPAIPFVSIARIPSLPGGGPAFRLWFHLDAGLPKLITNLPMLKQEFRMHVFAESIDRNSGQPTLGELPITGLKPEEGRLNVFDVDLSPEIRQVANLRFAFEIPTLSLTDGTMLAEYFAKRNLKYLGHDGRDLITAYWSAGTGVDYSQPRVVATGAVDEKGNVLYGNFQCALVPDPTTDSQTDYLIMFPAFEPGANYVVKGTPINTGKLATAPVLCNVQGASPIFQQGIVVQLCAPNDTQPVLAPFMVEVTELPQRQ